MVLREVINKRMREQRYRVSDIARIIGRDNSTVSLTLNKEVDSLKMSTFKRYLEAVGIPFNVADLVNK